jgi:hypothetical protein
VLFDQRRRRVVGVLVAASLVLATLGWGYRALAAPGPSAEDRLVTKGVQQVTICGGQRESDEIWYKLTEEVPGAKGGTWGTDRGTWGLQKDGDCKVWYHYTPGPAD